MSSTSKLSRKIKFAYKTLHTWRRVAKQFGVSTGTIFRAAHGYEPKDPHIRARLGLAALVPAPMCPIHGVVHVGRCPRRRVTRIQQYTVAELRWALENREEMP